MVKKFLPLAVLAAIVSITLVACGTAAPPPAPTPTAIAQSPPPPPPAPPPAPPAPAPPPAPPGGTGGGTSVTVNLEDPAGSGEYLFDPAQLTFSAGETVTFTLTSESEFHTFYVDELGIEVDVDAEQTETLTFTFNGPGEYRLYCLPHETLGMVGTIIVQ